MTERAAREALVAALKAWDAYGGFDTWEDTSRKASAMAEAIRSTLASTGLDAPVAWRVKNDFGHWHVTQDKALADTYRDVEKKDVQPLYLATQTPVDMSLDDTDSAILNEIREALECRGYVHMTNGRDIGRLLDELDHLRSEPQRVRDSIAECIWRAEYRRATGKERLVPWSEVAPNDQDKYLFVADAILALSRPKEK